MNSTIQPSCCALPSRLQKDRDTLIEQSNILLKQSVDLIVPCQLTQSSYATDHNVVMYIRGGTQSIAIFEVFSAQVYIYTYIYSIFLIFRL